MAECPASAVAAIAVPEVCIVNRLLLAAWFCLHLSFAHATPGGIFKAESPLPVAQVYEAVYAALEEARFWVVFEADILRNIGRFEQRWGEDFNRAGLDAIRSMVVCNGWFANRVSGLDPDLLALCPLRVGFYAKDGVTSVVFARPTAAAQGSDGYAVVEEIEKLMIEAIRAGLAKAGKTR